MDRYGPGYAWSGPKPGAYANFATPASRSLTHAYQSARDRALVAERSG